MLRLACQGDGGQAFKVGGLCLLDCPSPHLYLLSRTTTAVLLPGAFCCSVACSRLFAPSVQQQTLFLLAAPTTRQLRYHRPLGSFTPCKSSPSPAPVPPYLFPTYLPPRSCLFIPHNRAFRPAHVVFPTVSLCLLAPPPLSAVSLARTAYSPPCWQKPHTDRSTPSRLNLTSTTTTTSPRPLRPYRRPTSTTTSPAGQPPSG
jgi:hypothetical protein